MHNLSNIFSSAFFSKIFPVIIQAYLAILFVSTAMNKALANDMMNLLLLLVPVGFYVFSKISLSNNEKWFIGFSFLIAAYAIFSYLYHPVTGHSGPKLTIQLKYMLAFSVLMLMYACRFSLKNFLLFNAILCVIAGLYVAYFLIIKDYHLPPGLKLIPFGNLLLLSSVITLMSVSLYKNASSRLLLCVIFLLGAYASLGSGTRSSWIAFPFMLVLVFMCLRSFVPTKKLVIIACFVMTMSAIIIANDSFQIRSEMLKGYHNTLQYFSKNKSSSSMGQRLDMWKVGWLAFKENPMFGLGLGHTKAWYHQKIKDGTVPKHLHRYKHFHNSYINNLASKGIVGSLIFLAFIIFLLNHFFQKSRAHDKTHKFIGFCGLLIVISFLLFSFTDSFFELTMTATYFIISMSMLLYIGKNSQHSSIDQSISEPLFD